MNQSITLIYDAQTQALVSLRYPHQVQGLIDLIPQPRRVNDVCKVFTALGLIDCDVTELDGGRQLKMEFPLAQFVSAQNLTRLTIGVMRQWQSRRRADQSTT